MAGQVSIFDRPLAELRRWGRGDPVRADQLNEPVEALNRILAGVAPGRMVPSRGRGPPGMIEAYRIYEEHPNYLTGRLWDSVGVGSQDTLIAKPWDIRESTTERLEALGFTVTYALGFTIGGKRGRKVTRPDGTYEFHLVGEPYLIRTDDYEGDIIWAIAVNHSGVIVAGQEIPWLDLNVAAREWVEA